MKKTENKKTEDKNGVIVRVAGPVVDVYFKNELPEINEALLIKLPDKKTLTLEVQFAIGDREVKTLAFGPTEGVARGMKVERTNAPILVPVGKNTLGTIFNVLGQSIDGKPFKATEKELSPIHKDPPTLEQQETKPSVLETGIKVIDLMAPFTKGGKIAVFGGAGVGKT